MKGPSTAWAPSFQGSTGDVYTCCVDTEKKLVYIFLFGELLAPPKRITLSDEQIQ